MANKMNVTPEVIGRLRRLATSAVKRKDPQWNGRPDKNGDKDKEELQTNAKQNKDIDTNSGGGSSTGTNGRISLVLSKRNETENDMATPGNKEAIKEGDIKMDMDVFRQMLKEVIVKRTFEIEKRLMGDVEALKKQVLALETEKEKLQWDAKRLQRTLNEVSFRHGKGQERPGSSQIDNKVVETSTSIKNPVSPNQPQKTDKTHHVSAVDSEAADSYKIDGNTKTLEQVRSSERKRGSLDSRVSCNTSEVETAKQVPVPIVDGANRSSAQNGRGPLTLQSSSQGQRKPSDTQELQMHMRGSESAHRHLPEARIDAPRPLQGHMSQPPARPAVSPNPQTHGQPSVRPTGQELPAASSPNITGHAQGQLTLQPQWLPSQPQRPNIQVQMTQPTQADDVPSYSYPVVRRGPPNVTLFNPYKRRKVDKRSSSNDLHVVSSNSNYVMHNFKLQKIPTALDNLRKRFKKSVSNSGGNQAVYTTSPSNQPRGPYFNQSSSNVHPVVYPEQHPIHATDKAPVNPQGLSQGQLVERVFYPLTGPRQTSTEYGPRVMSTHPRHQVQPARANGQPVQPNGTMYVVREYQVPQQGAPIQAERVPPSHIAAPLQHIAPAPPGISRSQPHSPVQSPGISSTASPSGRPPGDPNVGHDPRGTANQSGNVVRNDHPGVQLRTPPPKPSASIVVVQDGIVLSWNMRLDETMAQIDNYELFACQDGAESTAPPIMWKKIGIVKALPLPMACTLSQFSSGNKYNFAVRAVDDQERAGPFSDPCTISLTS